MEERTIRLRCRQCDLFFLKKYRIYRKAKRYRSYFFCSIRCVKSYQSKLFTRHPKKPPKICPSCQKEFRERCKLCKMCRATLRVCAWCQTIFKKGMADKSSKCLKCRSKYRTTYWIAKKIKAIEFLGGRCMDCGFAGIKEYYLMDFHHRDPNTKDVIWGHLRKRSWDKIHHELFKCDLLCVMCHRRRHHAVGNGSCSNHIKALSATS